MKFLRLFLHKKRYKEPLFKRIMVVVLAFVVMIGAASMMAGSLITQRLAKQAEAVVTQTMLKLDADLMVPATTVYYASETALAMLQQGINAQGVSENLAYISSSFEKVQTTGLEFSGLYGYFGQLDGGTFVDTGSTRTAYGQSPVGQPWYDDAIAAQGELATTQVFQSTQLGEAAISCSRLISDANGTPVGVIAIDISLKSLRSYFVDMRFSREDDGSYGFLMNDKLEIIAHPEPSIEGVNMHDLPIDSKEFKEVLSILESALLPGGEETEQYEYEMDDYKGDYMVASTVKMENGWLLTLVTPVSEYYGELTRMEAILLALGALLATLIIFMLVRLDKARKAAEVTSRQKGERLRIIENLRRADERAKIIFDSTPVASVMFNEAGEPIDCNRAAQELFAIPSKDEMIKQFWDLHPKTQPNGRLSSVMAAENQQKTLGEGRITFEWMFVLPNGEQMPAEVTLILVLYQSEPMVAGYYRDLREFKAMLSAIGARTAERDAQYSKLAAVTQNYKGIVWSVDNRGILTTFRGQYLEKLGFKPAFVEGNRVEDVQPLLQVDFTEYTQKTRREGPQNWTMEIGGAIFHGYTVPIYDEEGREAGIVGSIDDVTEAENMKRELENALTEAKVANNAKSSFLANMSHEIRTPMNAILGITEILAANDDLPADIEEGLAKIYASCNLLLGIINDVLDFSKIEAGKLDITSAPYEVASLVNDSIQLNMMRIGSKPIEFKVQIDENIPMKLIGDELRIKQILNNLLSNAFKYTEAGVVALRIGFEPCEDNKIMLIIGVQDTGAGMTKQQVDKLFDEYTRFQTETNRMVEGTGLGMAITQRLVHLMQGDIQAISEPGKGSLFVVGLPQQVETAEVLGAELAENLRNFNMSAFTNRKRAQPMREPMPYGKVLVVDDVETNIYVAVGLLRMYELHIDTAMSGDEAVQKVKDGNVYDIIFMDHMMPGMDGVETTKCLRKLGYTAPIVALTANAVAKQAEKFLKNGFDDFIAKPIDTRQLNIVLNRLIRDKQPPEVIADARRKKASKTATEDTAQGKPDLLISSFVRDANKALLVLDEWVKARTARDDEAAANSSELKEDLRKFTITVHGMKSALANIGEAELSAEAKRLEDAGKSEDIAYITEAVAGFVQKLRELLQKVSPPAQGAAADENAKEDIPDLREKLAAVEEFCEDYDRKGATGVLEELIQKSKLQKTREVLDGILEAVLHSDFEEAAQMAHDYAQTAQDGMASEEESLSEKDVLNIHIEGLNVEKGFAKYNGDVKAYIKILRSYAASVGRLLGTGAVPDEKELANYEIAVHGIKGASRDIFAEAVGESAAGLEDAANNGNWEYIRLHQPAFYCGAQRLCEEVLAALDAIDKKYPKPKKTSIDVDVLERLCAACETYNMDGVDAAMIQIDAYEYENGEELACWLRQKADVADFAAIAKKLRH